jgi:hypothetical protein
MQMPVGKYQSKGKVSYFSYLGQNGYMNETSPIQANFDKKIWKSYFAILQMVRKSLLIIPRF